MDPIAHTLTIDILNKRDGRPYGVATPSVTMWDLSTAIDSYEFECLLFVAYQTRGGRSMNRKELIAAVVEFINNNG